MVALIEPTPTQSAEPKELPAESALLSNLRRGNPGLKRKPPYVQACILQEVVFQAAIKKEVKPADLSSLARAWSEVEERKRILRGKFKAGDIRAADLDPVRLAWTVKRFTQANRKTLRGLPGMQSAVAIEAEIVEQKAAAPAAPRAPDKLPGDVTP
jgi:hypothetical protein